MLNISPNRYILAIVEIAVFHLETDSSGCAARGNESRDYYTGTFGEQQTHSHTQHCPVHQPPTIRRQVQLLPETWPSLFIWKINFSYHFPDPHPQQEPKIKEAFPTKAKSKEKVALTFSQQVTDSRTCPIFTHSWDDL